MAHVFVSYVREDQATVDRLVEALRGSGRLVWLDREKIEPGQRWQVAIRQAIESGAYFVACFSQAYYLRARSYMNEELTIAIVVKMLAGWALFILVAVPMISAGVSACTPEKARHGEKKPSCRVLTARSTHRGALAMAYQHVARPSCKWVLTHRW